MTNKEKYKRAFSVLHASKDISLDAMLKREAKKNFRLTPALAACLCMAFLLGSMTVAYAADIGGIREIIYAWIHGARTEIEVTHNSNGGYDFIYQEDGTVHEDHGGGVGVSDDGQEERLPAGEVIQNMEIQLDKKEDGSVWLYYNDRAVDITNLLIDNACKVFIIDGNKKTYFDIGIDDEGFSLTSGPRPTGEAKDYILVG